MTWRAEACERLATRSFDLLVIGAGIIGAGVAAEAARRGLDVALVDRGDFGEATSSASSKLIHGGLRYLRMGDLRLVGEAHRERRALMREVAPHLVRRLEFLLPLYRQGPYRPATVQTGLVVYSTLARARLSRLVSPAVADRRVPGLRLDGLRSCGLYADAVTNDSRLCLANVRAAADAGATVLNHAAVVSLRSVAGRAAGAEVTADGQTVSVAARATVNATGPWVDHLRRLEDPGAPPTVRLSKGVHALLELRDPWSAAITIPQDRVRVSFAIPWHGMLLLGTTDEPFDGDPDQVEPTDRDLGTVLEEASIALDPKLLDRDRLLSTYAGLRVLPVGTTETEAARRDTVLSVGPLGMISVAGGKLTTYRRIALSVLGALRAELGLNRVSEQATPLPGAVDPDLESAHLARLYPDLDPTVRDYLVWLYGCNAEDVLRLGEDDEGLLQLIDSGGPDLRAQAVFAASHEWACDAQDILRRRTTLAARGLVSPDLIAEVDALRQRTSPGGLAA